jgi:hypothetical protein
MVGKKKQQTVRTLQVIQHMCQRIGMPDMRRLGQQVRYNLGVGSGFEDAAVRFVFVPQPRGVNQVAIMCHRHLALGIFGHKRLAINRPAGAGCRIPNVPDCGPTGQFLKNVPAAAEYAPDRAHTRIALQSLAVTRCDTGRLLSTVLKAVAAKIRLLHRLGIAKYAEQTAILFFLGNHKVIVVYCRPFVNLKSEI